MIFSIRGILGYYELGFVIVDINGISLHVFVPNSMMSKLPSVGEEVFLYTHFIVRQEELSLYGFMNAQDKAIFSLLLSVNGVGPKSALGLLSIFDSVSIAEAVVAGDIDTISKAPGLGKKTASRVVLELQSKLSGSSGFEVLSGSTTEKNEIVGALLALGYSSMEIRQAIDDDLDSDAPLEEQLRIVLQRLGR
ncbi:MAG: Holliday junction branch migration protein RuvA [Dehalococcoidia bacterium]|nr:Holliday junction branch migration protein RuvA [Dehalococcoidia bacterium]|tara:strand:+ start:1062 stop:1640 length:579 start_codon:yes stop_codon:yes gene_type:complete